jgi:thioesterase domain-containing protein
LHGLSVGKKLEALLEHMKSAEILPINSSANTVKSIVKVFRTHDNTKYYTNKNFDGKILLINPQDEGEEYTSRKDPWSAHAKEFYQEIVPGNHMTMMTSEHVHVLSRLIEEAWLI